MGARNAGLIVDPLFVAVTRPPMRWGVTYSALMCNLVFTMEVFLLAKNLLVLLIAVPIHGLCALLCARDARCFDLLMVWAQTRLPAYVGNFFHWQASSYSPLRLDVPRRDDRRRWSPTVQVSHRSCA